MSALDRYRTREVSARLYHRTGFRGRVRQVSIGTFAASPACAPKSELTRKRLRRGVIPPSDNPKPISVLSSNGTIKILGPSNGPNLPNKSWLQCNASATKRRRHYTANFKVTVTRLVIWNASSLHYRKTLCLRKRDVPLTRPTTLVATGLTICTWAE